MLAANMLSSRLSQVSHLHLFLRISALHASAKPASALWRPGLALKSSQSRLFQTVYRVRTLNFVSILMSISLQDHTSTTSQFIIPALPI